MDKTILACDDEKHMLRLLEFNLKKTDCRILTASSGRQVLEILQEDSVDLLIIDIMMPEMDGFETIRQARELEAGKNIPVVILTGRGQSNTKDEAEALGISEFLTKPFSPIQLKNTIKRFLQ
ncbi:MAG: response regulator [Verrucomicrobiota bacterium]